MAEAFDQIGAAIPACRLRRIGFERAGLMEQRVPSRQQRTQVERKRERGVGRLSARTGGCAIRIGIERLQVGVGCLGKMRIGKRRIELPAVAMDALAHRALEGGIGPRADAGLGIGRDVGAVDGAERRFERPAAGIEDAVRGWCGRPRSRRARPVAGRGRWSPPNRPTHPAARSARSTATAARPRAMPTTAAHKAATPANTPRRLANGFCHAVERRSGFGRRRRQARPALRAASPRNPRRIRSGVNGSSRKRTPVASKIALAIAAALGTEADSPTPSGG